MMAFVFSDSHGDRLGLRQLIEAGWERYGLPTHYLHCGDGAGDLQAAIPLIRMRHEDYQMMQVRGNCDFHFSLQEDAELSINGCRIYMTHGHHYGVKSSLYLLDEAARERQCSIALFGHTHQPTMEMRSVLMLNPGAAQDGRMLALEITDEGKPRVHMINIR